MSTVKCCRCVQEALVYKILCHSGQLISIEWRFEDLRDKNDCSHSLKLDFVIRINVYNSIIKAIFSTRKTITQITHTTFQLFRKTIFGSILVRELRVDFYIKFHFGFLFPPRKIFRLLHSLWEISCGSFNHIIICVLFIAC